MRLMDILALSALLMVASAVWASAEIENDGVGDDAAAFSSGLGAKVRLLQLESSIERNILSGNEVVAAIRAANSGADTSELEGILAELESLKSQVSSAEPAQGEEGAKEFVDLKGDAISLSKEFREKARHLLKTSDLDGLRGRIRQIDSDSLKSLRQKINGTRHEYNADQLQDALDSAGLDNQALVDEVRSGQAGLKEVREFIKGSFENMSGEQKKQTLMALREADLKGGVFLRSVADKVALNQANRMEGRLERRLALSDQLNMTQEKKDKIKSRLGNVSVRQERIQTRFQSRIDRVENITQRRIDRLENRKLQIVNSSDRALERIEQQMNRTLSREENLKDRLDGVMDGKGQGGNGGQGGQGNGKGDEGQ